MRKACLVVSDYLNDNRIFDADLHRDNFVDRFVQLKKAFKNRGYDLSTQDVNSIDESEVVIYASNMPKVLPKPAHVKKSYIILSESPFIKPENYDTNKHLSFNKVFTWFDKLVDGKKYIKLNYAHAFPTNINKNLDHKKRLCVLIAGNKKPQQSIEDNMLALDLYFEREEAIRWFEKNQPNDFDLYGVGWNKYKFSGHKIFRALNHIPYFSEIFLRLTKQTYLSYRGTVEHKRPIMESYRFSICYENARDIPGYITEKIFDSFFAGCVPVYWGANNVADYIPENCYIDKRRFSSYKDLHKYLSTMSDSDYRVYLDNIQSYLNSASAYQFRSEGFVQTIVETIFNDQGENKS